MASTILAALACVVFCPACAKKEPSRAPRALAGQTQPAALGEAGRPEASPAPSTPKPATAIPTGAPLAPLASGRRVRIRKLEDDVDALEITVPPGFKLRMEGNEELPPSAHLVGPDLEIVIREPDGEFYTLAEEKDHIAVSDPDAAFLRAVDTEEGHLIIDRNNLSGMGRRYDSIVSRPKLKVTCVATGLERLSYAELAAAVCLTLRLAPFKGGN